MVASAVDRYTRQACDERARRDLCARSRRDGDIKDVAAFREYLVTLRKLVSDAQAAGMSGEALADAVIPRLRDRYSRWNGFDDSARPNILETDAELRGKKRIPQADSTR